MASETRFMRSDTHTVNGLTAFKLQTAQSASFVSMVIGAYDGNVYVFQYLGIKAWKRAEDGTETPITSQVIALASHDRTALISAADAVPQTGLEETDAVVVRVYGNDFSPPTTLLATFITEQLGATELSDATWTVYYYLLRQARYQGGVWLTTYYFYFGMTTYNSRIENFTWSIGGGPPTSSSEARGDGLSWAIT